MAFINAYDLNKQREYLATAAGIFEDMRKAWTTPCGGIWWDRNQTYVNAIANELFLSVAAHLANRDLHKKSYYVHWAEKEWSWFQGSGLINARNTINDGLDNKTCNSNRGTVWSYNQGVLLGGLVELELATDKGRGYVARARSIASAAISQLTRNGILHEPCENAAQGGNSCGADGPQFKGIFVRNLRKLHAYSPDEKYKAFIKANAHSIWNRDRKGSELGLIWSDFRQPVNASMQSSALDALVAAVAVA